ncbi:hypothetical protein [Pseudomonas thivervalensis]|uniref:hypothetical protein n=1 Tax=Pseudomonas thivervalensis TaxID=86265 RepID=UPI00069FC500|nr:hypothetical protein [Pseudomonas thivervalensis]
MLTEEPKRLAPTGATLRELFLKSGNLCAYPDCPHLMMDMQGVFIGQVCHIEAAEEGGQRFNSYMTNEDRRHFQNLMLMCHAHHKITDDVTKYPVVEMQRIKADHERRYASPEKLMLDSIRDWTRGSAVNYPKNLRKLLDFLGVSLQGQELDELLQSVTGYIDKYRKIPMETRAFFSEALSRIQLMSDTNVVMQVGWAERGIYAKDLVDAFRMSSRQVHGFASSLANYGVASIQEVQDSDYMREHIFAIHEVDDWPFWSDIAKYCAHNNQQVSSYAIDMRFDDLDH